MICGECGAEIARARSGKLVHIAEVPRGYDEEHEAVEGDADAFRAEQERESDLRLLADEMLVHHATLHPEAGCPWAERLRAAVRSRA